MALKAIAPERRRSLSQDALSRGQEPSFEIHRFPESARNNGAVVCRVFVGSDSESDGDPPHRKTVTTIKERNANV